MKIMTLSGREPDASELIELLAKGIILVQTSLVIQFSIKNQSSRCPGWTRT